MGDLNTRTASRQRAVAALIPLAALMVAGAAIRWHNIGNLSLWLDEIGEVAIAQLPVDLFVDGVRAHAAAAPLDYVGVRLTVAMFGFSTVSARLWAFVMGLMLIPAVYGLALELGRDRRPALVAATLTAVGPFLVFYSQEARFYATAALMTVVVFWALARAIRLGRWVDWVLFAVSAILAVYAHYFLALILAVCGLVALTAAIGLWLASGRSGAVARESRRIVIGVAGAGAVAMLAFLPWYLEVARGQLGIIYHYPPIPSLTLERLLSTLQTLLVATPRALPLGSDVGAAPLTIALLALAAIGAAVVVRSRPTVGISMLIVSLGLIPFVWWTDMRTSYFVSERQFIFLVPLVAVLAASGAVSVADALARRLRSRWAPTRVSSGALVVGLGLVIAGMGPGLGRVHSGDFRPKEDWRGAAAYVVSESCPGSLIYTNVGPGSGFGVAVYAPELAGRMVYLQEAAADEFLVDTMKRYPISSNDIVVIFREAPRVYVAGHGNLQTVTDHLYSRLRAKDFTPRLRVFANPGGCRAP